METNRSTGGRRQVQKTKYNGHSGHDTRLSRGLSQLLRHGAPKENVTIHSGGFVDVDEILKLQRFSQWTVENIENVVANNDKQRFTLRKDPISGKLQICANQGHSFEVEDPLLEPINDPSSYPTVIHGTYLKCWNSIRQQGLSKMNRTHIHFALGEPGTEGVISGMRRSAEVYIYVDISKAMQDGIKFYISRNNVILTPGNADGILSKKYFSKVVKAKTNEELSLL